MQINKQNSPLFNQGKAKWEAFVRSYGGPYNFSMSVYAGMNQKIAFVCPTHGVVQADAKNLINGKKCQQCAFADRVGKNRLTKNKTIQRFIQQHGDRYDYSHVQYNGQQSPVTIICKRHGSFEQKPEFHWSGSGCPQCFSEDKRGQSQKDTLESFTLKLANVFGDLFDTSKSVYVSSNTSITVRCSAHNSLCLTKPNALLAGNNPCTKCNHMKSSQEDEIAKFLSIFTKVNRRDRTIISPKELDIVLPEYKLAVEYSGMFWHSHGTIEEELQGKHAHCNKYKSCANKGIRLITIYESEWKNNPKVIKRLLRNSIGKTKGRLMARKCEIKKVSHAEAISFYDKYHPQGGNGSGEHYGLYWKDKLVSCMRFTFGVNDRGRGVQGRVWTLSRYASRVTVSGGASKLFKAFLSEHKPNEVKSFSDNRYFSGIMYEQLGFLMEEETPPDYQIWSMKKGLLPKSNYQRRNIPTKLKEHGIDEIYDPETDSRTEREMTYFMGARRIYDCGKKRWVWKPNKLLAAQ